MSIQVDDTVLKVVLSDGREIAIPTAWFERLSQATSAQLQDYEISPSGYGIHWPQIDEDISVKAFIEGLP